MYRNVLALKEKNSILFSGSFKQELEISLSPVLSHDLTKCNALAWTLNEVGTSRSTLYAKLRTPDGLKNVNFDIQTQISGKCFIGKTSRQRPFKKHFWSKGSFKCTAIRHGKQTEKVVRSLFARKTQKHVHKNFTVYDYGLVRKAPWDSGLYIKSEDKQWLRCNTSQQVPL